jgi:hypothetical protein
MRARCRLLAVVGWSAVLAWSAHARADGMLGFWPVGPGGGNSKPFDLHFEFFSQVELGAFVSVGNFSDFGGVGAKASLDVAGFGGAIGGRWERDRAGSGGLGFLEAQLRPFELAEWRGYRFVDPYFAAGSELGSSAKGYRYTRYAGGGVDVALWPSDVHPAFTAEYVYRFAQTPAGFAAQALSLGLALRSVF